MPSIKAGRMLLITKCKHKLSAWKNIILSSLSASSGPRASESPRRSHTLSFSVMLFLHPPCLLIEPSRDEKAEYHNCSRRGNWSKQQAHYHWKYQECKYRRVKVWPASTASCLTSTTVPLPWCGFDSVAVFLECYTLCSLVRWLPRYYHCCKTLSRYPH